MSAPEPSHRQLSDRDHPIYRYILDHDLPKVQHLLRFHGHTADDHISKIQECLRLYGYKVNNDVPEPHQLLRAFYDYIVKNDIPGLQHLLRASPALDLRPRHGSWGAPLHIAAYHGRLAAVDVLLDAGVDALAVSTREDSFYPPISIAIQRGHLDIADRLWRHSSPESHADYTPVTRTCLVQAAMCGEVSFLDNLLGWWNGWTQTVMDEALCWASSRWQLHSVDLLLTRVYFDRGVLNEALHYAADYKWELELQTYVAKPYVHRDSENVHQQQLIARLVDAGADPNTYRQHQPLLIHAACSINLTGALMALLEKGADPNATDAKGISALHYLSSPVYVRPSDPVLFNVMLNEPGIRLLLQHGADVCQRSKTGDTPLHWAAYGSNLPVFRLFLSFWHGSDVIPRMRNNYRQSLLHFAAAGCKIDILEFLIAQGMDVNAQNTNGWSPLMCALAPIHRDSFRRTALKAPSDAVRAAWLLLSHGADPTLITDESWTSLHCLALHKSHDVSGELAQLAVDFISRGVDIEARAPLLVNNPRHKGQIGIPWGYRLQEAMGRAATEEGPSCGIFLKPNLTPLYWAVECGNVGVVKVLTEHGAQQSHTDPDGLTAARTAAESKYLKHRPQIRQKIIDLLVSAVGVP